MALVIDERFFQLTQSPAVIVFPAEITRVRCGSLESDHGNAPRVWFAGRKESLFQLLLNPQPKCRLAHPRWPNYENQRSPGWFLDGSPKSIANCLQLGMRDRIGTKVREALTRWPLQELRRESFWEHFSVFL